VILGLGLGRDHHYDQFEVPREKRVRRFLEGVELIKALWTQPEVNYHGTIYKLEHGTMAPKGVQKPHVPIWMGGGHPNALKRAATIADGWMGSGGSSKGGIRAVVPIMRENLEKAGRDPKTFPLSKRVFLSVHERADTARPSCTTGSRPCITTPTGPKPAASTARRSRCASALKSWPRRARIISC
jgi:alkanesulfonate monooxygenase SsuD/methylene tetrahydromethanopterin reductase-like flavin-dependent oxidoreductase (luciferase family)